MDFGEYWQENKRFLITIGAGLLVFLIGQMIVEGAYGTDLSRAQRERRDNRSALNNTTRFTATQRDEALEENEAQRAALATLSASVEFEPRPDFVIDSALGSASGQYFNRVEGVREELDLLASRSRMAYPDGWGIEMLETNSLGVLVRQLEALDMIDRVVHLAIEAGVQRITKIQVRFDSSFGSRQGTRPVERTEIDFAFATSSESMTRLVALTQSDRYGRPLTVQEFEIKGERNKLDSVKADLSFLVVRLHDLTGEEE